MFRISTQEKNTTVSAREPCSLYCMAETLNYIFTIKHQALDGTSCSLEGGICIEGSCQVYSFQESRCTEISYAEFPVSY